MTRPMNTATTKAWEARWMFASDETKLEIDENVKDVMGTTRDNLQLLHRHLRSTPTGASSFFGRNV
jgi:hypothetical protein